MQTNCLPLNWQSLTKEDHIIIKKCVVDYRSFIKTGGSNDYKTTEHFYKEIDDSTKGFFHLFAWDHKERFFSELLNKYNINKTLLDKLSIQQSFGPLPPHSDIKRQVTAFYLVDGVAETVFYSKENTISGTIYNCNDISLTEIERVKMNPGNWYLFNNYCIHQVVCSETVRRTSLVLDLTQIFSTYENAVESVSDNFLFL